MQATALFEYPEFIAALFLSVVALLGLRRESIERHAPDWLAEPARFVLNLLPAPYHTWTTQTLIYAGLRNSQNFGDFASFKVYAPLFSLTLMIVMPPHLVAALAIALWCAPDLFIIVKSKGRQSEIRTSLPQALDLMLLCVDAGLGLDATLHRLVSDNAGLSNALNQELAFLDQEILLGVDRERAYQQLYNRTGVDELKTLGSALHQAGKLGLSIARILRAQSDLVRKRQSQKAEERAMKMPIYMAFPLWFFIMPALMVLVLAPPLIRFYHQMH